MAFLIFVDTCYKQNKPKYTGLIHSHYTGLLSIFSPADLKQLYGMIANNSVKKDETFIYGLVTPTIRYILKFKNVEQFLLFGYIHLDDENRFKKFSEKYEGIESKGGYDISQSKSHANNEQQFLKMMKEYNMGLEIFKGNETFTEWRRIGLDENNNVVNKPCN